MKWHTLVRAAERLLLAVVTALVALLHAELSKVEREVAPLQGELRKLSESSSSSPHPASWLVRSCPSSRSP